MVQLGYFILSKSFYILPDQLKLSASLCHNPKNLECNRLRRLPETFADMNCKILNVNSNNLFSLPRCIGSMQELRIILANDNRLKQLPAEIGTSATLEFLHLSRNQIMEIPLSIVHLYSLKSIWLDNNRLSAMPPKFHQLIQLKELKLDNNKDMVLPPLHILAKGLDEVMRWSERRLGSSEHIRVQNIILSVK